MDYTEIDVPKEYGKKEVMEALESSDPNWIETFVHKDPVSKQEIVWFLKEVLEKDEERKFLDRIMQVAELYVGDEDPLPEHNDLNKKIEAGEEVRFISTVRGTTCWLLNAIAATFRTEYYSRIISLIEKLAFDPVYYVRIQTTVPLSFFAANLRATQHKDGSPFNFEEKDKARVTQVCFKMLQEHRDIPRVLEGVTRVFDRFRFLNENQARQVVECFFYNSKGVIQPEYLTHQGVPLLIFFAEFRSNFGDGFDGLWFQDYAKKVLELPQRDAPHLRSTFEWHVWNEIESDPKSYKKLQKYIPLFLHTETFEEEPLTQYDFLTLQVLKVDPPEGVVMFQGLLNYIEKWAHMYDIREHAWMLTGGEIMEKIAPIAPEKLLPMLSQIKRILDKGVWIGDIEQMFKSYTLIPDENVREELYPHLKDLYEKFRGVDRVGKLGEL